VYIVLNGRLRAVQKNETGKKTLGDEYGRGEFVGLVYSVCVSLIFQPIALSFHIEIFF